MSLNQRQIANNLFVDYDGFCLEIYVSNGIKKTSQIFLEPSAVTHLLRYIEQVKVPKKEAQL